MKNKDMKMKIKKYMIKHKDYTNLDDKYEKKMYEKIRVRCSCELVIERRFLSKLRHLLHDSIHTFNISIFPEIKYIERGRVKILDKPLYPDENKIIRRKKREKSITYTADGDRG